MPARAAVARYLPLDWYALPRLLPQTRYVHYRQAVHAFFEALYDSAEPRRRHAIQITLSMRCPLITPSLTSAAERWRYRLLPAHHIAILSSFCHMVERRQHSCALAPLIRVVFSFQIIIITRYAMPMARHGELLEFIPHR